MIKLGIISFAHFHAYSYANCLKQLKEVKLVGVADKDEARGRKAAYKFETKYYRDYSELLQKDIEAVIVCSENSRHKEIVIAAANAGKHILCEKPISTNAEDAQMMIDVCKQKKVKLGIAFPSRFSPAIKQVKRMIEEDKIGNILAINATNRGKMPGGWFINKEKAGGGAVMDHTVHVADLLRWILNKEITEVYAEVDTLLHNIDVDDCGILALGFEDGIFATLDTSWSRPKSFPTWGDITMEIVGTKGVISLDAFAQTIFTYSDKERQVIWENWGDNIELGLIKDFVYRIANALPLTITGEDGLRTLEVALAAYRSAQKKKSVFCHSRNQRG